MNPAKPSMDSPPHLRFLRRFSGTFLAIAYFLVMFVFSPFREQFEFDADEGIEAMKALLVARGYSMYAEIWSEQPPLFTYLLAGTFRLFGFEVDVGRTLVLVFSAVLVGSSFYLLYLTWGAWHALAGAATVFLLPYYTTLSVSVMIGLPSIALAGVSLLMLALWHRQRYRLWLVLSAAALAASVLVKVFTVFLVPIFMIGLVLGEKHRPDAPDSALLAPALLWSLVFAGLTATLGLGLVGPGNLSQLFDVHFLARQSGMEALYPGTHPIAWHLREAWAVLLLAGLGTIFALVRKNWLSIYLLAWLGAAILLLSFHRPVWYHHQLLVTFPAALLAGIAAGEGLLLITWLLRRSKLPLLRRLLAFAALAGFALLLADRTPRVVPDMVRPPYFAAADHAPWPEQMFLVKMSNHAPETRWVVTNLPMYAFRVGLPVTPFLAVMSEKRLSTGELSEEQIIQIVDEVNPEQVLIGRRSFPELEAYLEQDYRLLYSRGKRLLYLRRDFRQ